MWFVVQLQRLKMLVLWWILVRARQIAEFLQRMLG